MCISPFRRLIVPFLGVVCLSVGGAIAQTTPDQTTPDNISGQDDMAQFVQGLNQDLIQTIENNPDGSLQTLMSFAYKFDLDGVVDSAVFENAKRMQNAMDRIRYLQPILVLDLDGDGAVSQDEFRIVAVTQDARLRATSEVMRLSADENQDNTISIGEALKYAQGKLDVARQKSHRMIITDEIPNMDINGDGQTTIKEIMAVVEEIRR